MTTNSLNLNTYTWTGRNQRGENVTGELDASTMSLAKATLRRQGIAPKKVRKKSKPFFSGRAKRITPRDITFFTRQLATMLTAGIPLVQAFDIVARGQANLNLEKLIGKIKNDVEAGSTFAEALRKHPKYFNELFSSLIDAGEQSGTLDIMLGKVATYKEKTESLKGKIKKALFYPAAVIMVAVLVTAGLLIFVVPQFESLFQGFGADLPAMTRLVINLSEIFQHYWWVAFVSAIIGTLAFTRAKQRSKKFNYFLDRASLKIPIIGTILEKAAIARFTRTLSTTFAAGLPLVDALEAVAGATGNLLYTDAAYKIRDNVSTGQQLHLSMRTTGLFPNMVIQMVAIGEESGSLEEMLGKVADFYEEEVDNAVDALSSLIEPLIMVILGTLVGGLVIAMYLPIFKLGAVV